MLIQAGRTLYRYFSGSSKAPLLVSLAFVTRLCHSLVCGGRGRALSQGAAAPELGREENTRFQPRSILRMVA